MILKWFDTKEVDAFAKALVEDLVKRYPPEGKDVDAKKATERLRRTHGVVFSRAAEFSKAAKLNAYKTARLGTQVKYALKEAGYPDAFVETFTIELVSVATLKGRGAS